jgi:hypothetical protein
VLYAGFEAKTAVCVHSKTLLALNAMPTMCSSRDQTVCFAHVTSLRKEGKQTYILCKPNTLMAYELRQRATKYCRREIMFSMDSTCLLTCHPSQPLCSPCLLLLTDVERTDLPRLLYQGSDCVEWSRSPSMPYYEHLTTEPQTWPMGMRV